MRRWWVGVLVAVLCVVGGAGGWIWSNRAQGERVLAIGDSLMAQGGTAVTQDLEAKGYDVNVSAAPGSGLLDTRDDWGEVASGLVANENPDIVIVEFIGDYGPMGVRPRSPQTLRRSSPPGGSLPNAWRRS
jgi:hypothetical protein